MPINLDPTYLSKQIPPSAVAMEDRLEGPVLGRWPRMLNPDEDTRQNLILWVDEEIRRARTERNGLIDDWSKWQEDYWAEPESEEKNFPFRKAANVVVPLTAIAVEAIYARLMGTLFSVEPFWAIRPRTKAWIEAAPHVQDWLQTEAENENSLDVYHFCAQILMEMVKLGTFVTKSGYERDIRKSVRSAPGGGEETHYVEVRNGPTLDYVPLSNFLIRLRESDPQRASWCGEEFNYTWGQLRRMGLSGRMDNKAVDEIRAFWGRNTQPSSGGAGRKYQDKIDDLANTEPIWHEDFEVIEIWASFDIDGDGIDEEIVMDYHPESMSLLSIRYNWYADLHRPYRHGVYFPVEGRFYGIGVGKQNEQFQEEVTTVHRQRLDNATLANMSMIKVKRTTGYGPEEPIFPGKQWFVDDSSDIEPLKLFEIYPSAYRNEDVLVNYSEKRTGVNEVILGMPSQGTPGTATGDLARLAEGNKRFDLVLKNVRRTLSLVGQDVLANFQQFGDQERHWLTLDAGKWVEQILRLPQELVMHGAIIELSVTDSIVNDQVDQQMWMSLSQVAFDYYSKQVELGMLYGQLTGDYERVKELLEAAFLAGEETYRRLLDAFNIIDKEKLLIQTQNLEALSGGQEDRPIGPGGAISNVGLQALPFLPQQVTGAGQGGFGGIAG